MPNTAVPRLSGTTTCIDADPEIDEAAANKPQTTIPSTTPTTPNTNDPGINTVTPSYHHSNTFPIPVVVDTVLNNNPTTTASLL